MKLQQLRYVLAIVDNRLNMTRAANQLYTSQPGISKQIKLLEAELGVQLFVRKGKSLSGVTPAGAQVIEQARVVMQEVEKLLAMKRARAVNGYHRPRDARRHVVRFRQAVVGRR